MNSDQPNSPKPAAENLYAFGFLDVARELIFVFPRVGTRLVFFGPSLVERFDCAPG